MTCVLPATGTNAIDSAPSISSLIEAMEAQHNNPHVSQRTKDLLLTAATVIVGLVHKVAELQQAQADQPRIILPG